MADVIEIERLAKQRLSVWQISLRTKIPEGRIINICKDTHVPVRL